MKSDTVIQRIKNYLLVFALFVLGLGTLALCSVPQSPKKIQEFRCTPIDN